MANYSIECVVRLVLSSSMTTPISAAVELLSDDLCSNRLWHVIEGETKVRVVLGTQIQSSVAHSVQHIYFGYTKAVPKEYQDEFEHQRAEKLDNNGGLCLWRVERVDESGDFVCVLEHTGATEHIEKQLQSGGPDLRIVRVFVPYDR